MTEILIAMAEEFSKMVYSFPPSPDYTAFSTQCLLIFKILVKLMYKNKYIISFLFL